MASNAKKAGALSIPRTAGLTDAPRSPKKEPRKRQQVEEVGRLPDTYFYNKSDFEAPKAKYQNPSESFLSLQYSFGFEGIRRNNIHFVSDSTVITTVGNVVELLNLKTFTQEYIPSFGGGGVGCITVHPNRKYIAIAEKRESPNIHIFEYPSLKLYRVLRNGTERAYADMVFNSLEKCSDDEAEKGGHLLASVGSAPDYTLTVWNWREERIILRTRAFSQEVFRVSFSPDNSEYITTSGVGHIKFWKMSNTFTGLKLQGKIGKFGSSEMTDISGFVELPDGKVLSGSEYGSLLLWDDGLIKCELASRGRRPCHLGAVEVLFLEDGELFTAGDDGYLRLWDFEMIDNADVAAVGSADGGRLFEMEPLDEIKIGPDVKIKSVVKIPNASRQYLIQDSNGHLWKVDVKKRFTEKLLSFHSGSVSAIDASPAGHRFASIGMDGTIRLHDYLVKNTLYKSKYTGLGGGVSLTYLPEALDKTGSTILAGFADGVVRVVQCTAEGFALHSAFKPHTSAVTHLRYRSDGAILATASTDGTVFLFRVTPGAPPIHVPIGFIRLPSTPQGLSFSPIEPEVFLVATTSVVIEYIIPEVEPDTTESYELRLEAHEFWLKRARTKDIEYPSEENPLGGIKIQKKEIIPEKNSDEETQAKSEDTEKKEDTVDENNSGNDNQEENDQGVIETKPTGSFMTLLNKALVAGTDLIYDEFSFVATDVMYLPNGNFLLSIKCSDGHGEIYECHMDSAHPLRFVHQHSSPLSAFRISRTGKYLLYGSHDGTLFIRNMQRIEVAAEDDGDDDSSSHSSLASVSGENNDTLGPSCFKSLSATYYAFPIHDINRGRVMSIASAFDDSHVFSSGADGNLFAFRVLPEQVRFSSDAQGDLSGHSPQDHVEDITDPAVYSLQEAKLKAERDKQLSDAEAKKQVTREYIGGLRDQFLSIIQLNKEAPPEQQADRGLFNVDPGLRESIEKHTEEKINVARKELEWTSIREEIGVEKIRRKFLSNLESERIVLNSFKAQQSLATFRILNLSPELQAEIKAVHSMIGQEKNEDREEKSIDKEKDFGQVEMDQNAEEDPQGNKKNKASKIQDTKSKLEAKKKLRAERAKLWKQLMDGKPDENYEDPNDVSAIRFAEANMGDYKLKSGENYIVPESERVDADKKRRQITLLKEAVYHIKKRFNNQVLRLRGRKEGIIVKVASYNEKIADIDKRLSDLGVDLVHSPWQPAMEESAFPEHRDRVTDEDIQKYLTEQAERAAREKEEKRQAQGFGGFDGVSKTPAASLPSQTQKESQEEDSYGAVGTEVVEEKESAEDRLTDTERREKEITIALLLHKKSILLEKISLITDEFDRNLNELRLEKVQLEGDLKFADMKLLLLYQEWVLLKEFEKYDNELAEKLNVKRKEKSEITEKIADYNDKLAQRKQEVEQILDKMKEIQEEFQTALGENNKHEDALMKIFRKRIKRIKKKTKENRENADGEENAEEGEGSEEEESEEEDSEDDSLDSDSGSEGEEMCPPDCDPSLYSTVCDLRERRLDIEDALTEIQKSMEILKKENEALMKKEKVIDAALRATGKEIQDFQTQKQSKLNELDVIVPLRFHQIQYLESNSLPQDLSEGLIFTNAGLRQLARRIHELQQEKSDIRKQHAGLRRMHVSLVKSRKEKQQKLLELEARALDVQMLKFGQVIDLEKIERMSVNKGADDLHDKIVREEARMNKELEIWDQNTAKFKRQLTEVTRTNTERLERLVNITEGKMRVENSLDHAQSHVTAKYSGPQQKEVQERMDLEHRIHQQRLEIYALRNDIAALVSKSGSVPRPGPPPPVGRPPMIE